MLESCISPVGHPGRFEPGIYLSSRRHTCVVSTVSNPIRSSYCSLVRPNLASPPCRSSSNCSTTLGHSTLNDFPGELSFTSTSPARSAALLRHSKQRRKATMTTTLKRVLVCQPRRLACLLPQTTRLCLPLHSRASTSRLPSSAPVYLHSSQPRHSWQIVYQVASMSLDLARAAFLSVPGGSHEALVFPSAGGESGQPALAGSASTAAVGPLTTNEATKWNSRRGSPTQRRTSSSSRSPQFSTPARRTSGSCGRCPP